MSTRSILALLVVAGGLTAGCISPSPTDRVQAYLGPETDLGKPSPVEATLPAGGFDAAFLVINDTTNPESAGPLSEPILAQMNVRAREQLVLNFPIRFSRELSAEGVTPQGNATELVRLAGSEAGDYMMLVLFSSEESEYAAYFGLGPSQGGGATGTGGVGGRPAIPGYQVQNFALVEMALLETGSGRLIIGANGRAWATLNRLEIPIESNNYPVVRRALHNAPIFPEEDVAYDTLRGVAADDALKEALMQLKIAWAKRFPPSKTAGNPTAAGSRSEGGT